MGSPRSNSKIKVFIADDSLIVREHLVTMLDELAGIKVVGQAENVAEAISGIRILQPDVVILDIRMPGGNGIDVLQTIKQDEVAPMVIILTNYPYPAYRQKCLQAGADFFLDKSTEFDQIPELFERFKRGAESGSGLSRASQQV
jgi:DNA-binding NarL/FixJ family response regulator